MAPTLSVYRQMKLFKIILDLIYCSKLIHNMYRQNINCTVFHIILRGYFRLFSYELIFNWSLMPKTAMPRQTCISLVTSETSVYYISSKDYWKLKQFWNYLSDCWRGCTWTRFKRGDWFLYNIWCLEFGNIYFKQISQLEFAFLWSWSQLRLFIVKQQQRITFLSKQHVCFEIYVVQ